MLKLSEAKCLEEVGKPDNPNYYIYHKINSQLSKNCYIQKEKIQALVETKVIKL